VTFLPRDEVTPARLARLFPDGLVEAPIVRQPDLQDEYAIFSVPSGTAAAAPSERTDASFGGQLRLVGYDLGAATLRRGDALALTLYWESLAASLPELIIFVHAYWPGGERGQAGVPVEPFAQSDGAPCGQTFTTTRWLPGEVVVDERTLSIPADYPAAGATLAVGVYAWPSLEAQKRIPTNSNSEAW
jgi:hypothetical protein